MNRVVLLYAVTCYLRNRGEVPETDFVWRLRVVNNLIQNSEDEVSDRTDRNRMLAILAQVDTIMPTGDMDDSLESNFNVNQIAEEKAKKAFVETHADKTESLFRLEDHPLLKGQIGVVGVDHVDYGERFESLFSCNWDLVDCAMMSVGDYGQRERNGWRYQYGSNGTQTAWYDLFHRSANAGFENTSAILLELLSMAESFTDEDLRRIADGFMSSCEATGRYPWRYYYVKYSSFRPGSYGKYSNGDAASRPYMFSVMRTRSQWSSNTYMPYLMEVDEVHLSRDSKGVGKAIVLPVSSLQRRNDVNYDMGQLI